MNKLEPSRTDNGNVKWCSHFGKVWQFLNRVDIELPQDPATPLLVIYLREIKAYVHTKTYTAKFRAAVSIVAKKWKQPKCPSIDT